MKLDKITESVRQSAFGLSMGAVWQHMTVELEKSGMSNDRVSVFFSILKRLMSDGVVKLARNGVFLTGDVDEQLNRLRNVWPENPSEDDLDGFGMWFLTEAPAGIVWINVDGSEVWT
ncbi:hypothetical protein DM40_4712 [Burkholderia cenocepacia]|uniref:DUF596 domain-containing protein n=1 Tax=Burkholderia latens TaxID=488446 RepID=UPI0004F5B7B9|nr:DUF596 domain-containing protein [Burkholderia latens]AIO39721.1 hypothetical protein DM40_4712 [Burkholderia cenocepacia]